MNESRNKKNDTAPEENGEPEKQKTEDIVTTLKNAIIEAYKLGKMPLTLIVIGIILIIAPFGLVYIKAIIPYILFFLISGASMLVIGVAIYILQIYWNKKMIDTSLERCSIAIDEVIDKYMSVKSSNFDTGDFQKLISAVSKLAQIFIGKSVVDFKIGVSEKLGTTESTAHKKESTETEDVLGLVQK